MSEHYTTPGGGGGGDLRSPSRLNPTSEIKFVSIAKVTEGRILLALPGSTIKRAFADEVRIFMLFFTPLKL
jgi:hypothetical protein